MVLIKQYSITVLLNYYCNTNKAQCLYFIKHIHYRYQCQELIAKGDQEVDEIWGKKRIS